MRYNLIEVLYILRFLINLNSIILRSKLIGISLNSDVTKNNNSITLIITYQQNDQYTFVVVVVIKCVKAKALKMTTV